MILIPKMKYEQLMNSANVKNDSKHDELNEKENMTPTHNHTEENSLTLPDVKEEHRPKPVVDDNKGYVRMKPKEFLKPKKREKSKDVIKQKWMTFHI